jgi:hypothetical protein
MIVCRCDGKECLRLSHMCMFSSIQLGYVAMNLLRLIIILLALSSYILIVLAQGCSDAGACSMNSFQPTMGIDGTDVSHHRVTVGCF